MSHKTSYVTWLQEECAGDLLNQNPRVEFDHPFPEDFLAAQRLAELEADQLMGAVVERAVAREWRNTLLFLFSRLVAEETTRAMGLLGHLIDHVEADDTPARLVLTDWIEILRIRGHDLDSQTHVRAVKMCLASMRGHGPAGDRCELGAALSRLGDPRFRESTWFLADDPLLGFVEVPAGRFQMGSNKAQDPIALDTETPQHNVTLPTYYIARYPVTVAQFRAYVASGGPMPDNLESLEGHPSAPVVRVAWREAHGYCRWLTGRLRSSGEAPADLRRVLGGGDGGHSWRVTLPSEAEWEKAARGTDGRIYPWGNESDANRANYCRTRIGHPNTVGCFPGGASPYGLEEMSGNVWEWTRSLCNKRMFMYPYEPNRTREDLAAREDAPRILRGGAFYNRARGCRAASRYGHDPDYRRYVGFRVAVSPYFADQK